VSSDIKIDLILFLTGCNLSSTAFKRPTLDITNFGYLQEEKARRLFIYLLILDKWSYTTKSFAGSYGGGKEVQFWSWNG